MAYLSEGRIKPLIAAEMPLTEARRAQEVIKEAKAQGKVVLICDQSY